MSDAGTTSAEMVTMPYTPPFDLPDPGVEETKEGEVVGADLVVNGSGNDVNGEYNPQGQREGKPVWRCQSGARIEWWADKNWW